MNERVVGHHEDGQEIVSTKHILAAKGPFGAIDALDPGARLRVLIETAQTFRQDHPEAPVRASELAVNEVLRLRLQLAEMSKRATNAEAGWTHAAEGERFWIAEWRAANAVVESLRRPLWQKIVSWFASFAP